MSERDIVRRVALGADHSSFLQKQALGRYLEVLGYRVLDVGCHSPEKVDYPDIAIAVCKAVVSGECERGIILDGAGIGSAMVANKIKGIRAAMCYDIRTVINSGSTTTPTCSPWGVPCTGPSSWRTWRRRGLPRDFGGGRHMARVNKIMAIERGR